VNFDAPAILRPYSYIIPEAILGGAACLLFLVAAWRNSRHLCGAFSLCAIALALLATWLGPHRGPSEGLSHSVLFLDNLALFVKVLALAGGAVLVLANWNEVQDRVAAEYHGCLLVILAGICLTGSANELITFFLALELVSIPTYVVLYLAGDGKPAQEAALKYFLLSIFSSALTLFGFSYLYGIAGTTYLPGIFEALTSLAPDGLRALAPVVFFMLVAGLGFRITAFPFHFYAPDVYQGTSLGNAALLAFAPKVAGFAALLRLTGYIWGDHPSTPEALVSGDLVPKVYYVLAVASMSIGNVLALLQDNLKRLLAYSSVAHAGYMLMGFAVAPYLGHRIAGGIDATLFYLVAYSAMTVGAFAVLACLSGPGRVVENVDDLAGLSSTRPGLAILMAILLFSFIGIPLTAGFPGKLLLFFGALGAPSPDHPALFKTLAVIGVLNAAVGAWYYLRILAVMYLRPPIKPLEAVRSWPAFAAIVLCALATLAFGIRGDDLHAYATRCTQVSEPVQAQR
jgi:NADH-quinone oxidoreductase subunit N